MPSAYKFIKFYTTSASNLNTIKIIINKLNSQDLLVQNISSTCITKKINTKNYAILGATESHALPIKLNEIKVNNNTK